ncbi:MAG: hypothetical protein ACRC2S_06870 [Waterburya sp.]
MVKYLQKTVIFLVTIYIIFFFIMLFGAYSIGLQINNSFWHKGILQSIIPDSYYCPQGCNKCNFNIDNFGLFYAVTSASCTLLGCPSNSYKNEHQLCSKNWMLSDYLDYDTFPKFVNNCINGYRNITYIKQEQHKSNGNFTAAEAKTPKHTRIALSTGIRSCNQLYQSLQEVKKFNEDILLEFSIYLKNRILFESSNTFPESDEKQRITNIKEIFDYLSVYYNNTNDILTNEMLEQFEKQYQRYQKK